MNANLSTVGFHDPKKFPKSADDLIGGKTQEPMSPEQWRAFAAAMERDSKPPKPKRKKKT